MKKPRTAPSQRELWTRFEEGFGRLAEILITVAGPTVDGKYLHWDRLKYYPPPAGLTHEDWWAGLKFHRIQAKPLPLNDVHGHPFSFNLVDPLPECLHHVDSQSRGVVQMTEPVTNPETKDRYLMRSLIEEAITSSQLEGASTTREVAKRMIREGRKPRNRDERMILNNFQTMREILGLKGEPLTKGIVFRLQGMVTDGALDKPDGSGRFRRADESIIVADDSGEVFHVPPPAEQLDERMELLCRFANGTTPEGFVHPLIRSIILHFWLAYDHPFVDGNGRTARAIFYWSMLRHGYWLFEFISISRVILHAPVQYGMAFLYTETDGNDLTYFLLYHAEVVRKAIAELHEYLESRAREIGGIDAVLRGRTTLNPRQRDIIGHALRHPGQGLDIESHRSSHGVVYETARSDFMDLVERGLFTKAKSGRFWRFRPVADLEGKLKQL